MEVNLDEHFLGDVVRNVPFAGYAEDVIPNFLAVGGHQILQQRFQLVCLVPVFQAIKIRLGVQNFAPRSGSIVLILSSIRNSHTQNRENYLNK